MLGWRTPQVRDSSPLFHATKGRVAGLILLLLLAACARSIPSSPTPEDAALCLARLDNLGVRYSPAPVPAGSASCTVDNPVSVSAAATAWNQPGVVSCAFAVKLDDFTREVIEPVALAQFGKHIRSIRHFGTYSCRREPSGRWSQHASGNAIDVAGFDLEDGTSILVERDWRPRGPKRDFLREIARRACEQFSVVLTPNSDRAHYNHIHLDVGPYRLCGA